MTWISSFKDSRMDVSTIIGVALVVAILRATRKLSPPVVGRFNFDDYEASELHSASVQQPSGTY